MQVGRLGIGGFEPRRGEGREGKEIIHDPAKGHGAGGRQGHEEKNKALEIGTGLKFRNSGS